MQVYGAEIQPTWEWGMGLSAGSLAKLFTMMSGADTVSDKEQDEDNGDGEDPLREKIPMMVVSIKQPQKTTNTRITQKQRKGGTTGV